MGFAPRQYMGAGRRAHFFLEAFYTACMLDDEEMPQRTNANPRSQCRALAWSTAIVGMTAHRLYPGVAGARLPEPHAGEMDWEARAGRLTWYIAPSTPWPPTPTCRRPQPTRFTRLYSVILATTHAT